MICYVLYVPRSMHRRAAIAPRRVGEIRGGCDRSTSGDPGTNSTPGSEEGGRGKADESGSEIAGERGGQLPDGGSEDIDQRLGLPG